MIKTLIKCRGKKQKVYTKTVEVHGRGAYNRKKQQHFEKPMMMEIEYETSEDDVIVTSQPVQNTHIRFSSPVPNRSTNYTPSPPPDVYDFVDDELQEIPQAVFISRMCNH
uniref:Uncharacterized protein n=1 Tax=Schizaphis graminum TaxID=13262 RepID=A0A2S2N933_SCHGA